MSTTSDATEVTEATSNTTTPPTVIDIKLIVAATDFLRTAERLERAGLVIDRNRLSPANRRAAFALQCHLAGSPEPPEEERPPIGFPVPRIKSGRLQSRLVCSSQA